MHTTILKLHKQSKSERSISKITNTHRSTVRKIIKRYKEENIETPISYARKSKLNKWHDQIMDLLSKDLSAIRIHEELRPEGCPLSYSAISKYIHKHNIKKNTCIRFRTKAGQEAQVDFGYVGRQYDESGKCRKAYVSNMRLSYSRMDYYEVVFDQTGDMAKMPHQYPELFQRNSRVK